MQKDTEIDTYNCSINGVLDTKRFNRIKERSWVFRTVGYGHGEEKWRKIFGELRRVGYAGVISIEHEDGLMTVKEGLEKAIDFLKANMIFEEEKTEMYWACEDPPTYVCVGEDDEKKMLLIAVLDSIMTPVHESFIFH